ncbi:MAG: bifunctional hydroxymethylpyrimidine kinase/phosphomethylpyrimidine kinase [Prevotella sp.]
MKHYKRVLAIAGSDSGGGAGIQADIKTISACGCYAMTAVTAVTVQNTVGVRAVHDVPPDIVEGQITAVLEDIGADAVKIGMLKSRETVIGVCRTLEPYKLRNIVLDPVMVSTSGHRLMDEDAVKAVMHSLAPMARLMTPNIPEAEMIMGQGKIGAAGDMDDAARDMAERTGVSVLLKGGHLDSSTLVDVFYDNEEKTVCHLPSPRIATANTHGTGCTLSSALASMLAQGMTLGEAVKTAKQYINEAIMAGAEYETGHGHGPVKHFYRLWK